MAIDKIKILGAVLELPAKYSEATFNKFGFAKIGVSDFSDHVRNLTKIFVSKRAFKPKFGFLSAFTFAVSVKNNHFAI